MRVLFVAQDSKLYHIERLADSIRRYGAETQVLRFSQYAHVMDKFPFTLLPSPKLLRGIVSSRPDIIFTDIYNYDSWASKLAGYPILTHMRGDYWSEFAYLYYTWTRQKSLLTKAASLWLRFVTERGIDFAHTILPICNWLATEVKRHRPRKRIRVLYQPIEPEIWTKEEDEGEMVLAHPAIVCVFHFHILPKVLGFIRFLDVARSMPQVNFYVAGSGPYLDYVLSQDPPGNMKFLGQLSYPAEVKSFLKEGDLYVHPSGQDACPLTLMEAELMQKAVISTDVGGVPEVIGDKRFLVKDGDTADWIRKIQWLLDHPGECETVGANGRCFIEKNFSLSTISKDLFGYMKEIATE